MNRVISTRAIERELKARDLLPANCRLIEISMTPAAALVIRYEVFVTCEQLGLVADAMKAAADEGIAADEKIRVARSSKVAP